MTAIRICLRLLLPVALTLGPMILVPAQASAPTALISIRLEQRLGDEARTVDQKRVFRSADILRFRLKSRLAGYLYIVDQGTTGEISTLFPAAGSGAVDNRIEPDHEYIIPADGDGWFQLSGPSGFDVVYFLVSANPIGGPSLEQQKPPVAAKPAVRPDLMPRCDDAIFKARGDCLDDSAGIAPLPPDAELPRELMPLARTASRDIILTDDGDATAVQPAATAKLPLIYIFRLAHRN